MGRFKKRRCVDTAPTSIRHKGQVKHLQNVCRQTGLFLLVIDGRWEFYDAVRGDVLLTWFEDSGRWTTPAGREGHVTDPRRARQTATSFYRNSQAASLAKAADDVEAVFLASARRDV